ncbi:hypothetical protein H9L39_03621 [Fusarium oxysporum f. sp. albedinis]|nr:hypothetical protein H9L39_03621 [Fusarium oxysporum f. sp. albedinis]
MLGLYFPSFWVFPRRRSTVDAEVAYLECLEAGNFDEPLNRKKYKKTTCLFGAPGSGAGCCTIRDDFTIIIIISFVRLYYV